jgi:hypothetical protein
MGIKNPLERQFYACAIGTGDLPQHLNCTPKVSNFWGAIVISLLLSSAFFLLTTNIAMITPKH